MTRELFDLILQPRINAKVLEIVHNHLDDEQIGLLLLKQINPYAVLTQQEEATLRGVNRKTLRGMKARGEISKDVNHYAAPKVAKTGPNFPNSTHGSRIMEKPL